VLIIRILFLTILYFLSANPAFAVYSYSRSVKVDHTQVTGGSDLTQFPILVCGNGSSPCNASISGLNQSGGGAHVQNSSGYDIVFGTDSACQNLLTWEMENYVASTGEFEAWVTNTSTALSHSADTTFYMCYGNSSISSFQSTASSVWDSNFIGVWHLSSLTADSTSNANNFTNHSATTTTGQIDGGANFSSGSSQYISTTSSLVPTATKYTLSGWAKRATGGSSVTWGQDPAGNSENRLEIEVWTDGNVYIEAEANDTTYSYFSSAGASWHYYVLVYDGTQTGNARINGYLDGTVQTMTIQTPPADISVTGGNFYFGRDVSNATYSNGILDEVRLSNTPRSAGWIGTEYNNQNAPSTFYTMGAETALSHQNLIQGVSQVSGVSLLN